jgi:hypothetical protein
MIEARTRRQVGIVSACLIVGVLLVACGDDDDDAAPTEAGAVTTEAAAVTIEAAATLTTEAEAVVTTAEAVGTTPAGVETSAAIDVVAPIAATSEPTASTGTSASSAPASSAPASEVCAARDELADSVSALGEVSISDLTSGGTSAITDALGVVRGDLQALGSAAGSEVSQQVQDVEDAIDEAQTAVQEISGVASARDALVAFGNVVSSAGTLLTTLGTRCPTSTVVIATAVTESTA